MLSRLNILSRLIYSTQCNIRSFSAGVIYVPRTHWKPKKPEEEQKKTEEEKVPKKKLSKTDKFIEQKNKID